MFRVSLLLLMALLAACRGEIKDPPKKGGLSESDLRRLHMLGYDPWVEETPDPDRKSGLVSSVPEKMFPGYTVFASRGACQASLVGPDGEVVHRWHGPRGGYWSDTLFLADGTLLVIGSTSNEFADDPVARFMRALDWNSNVLWQSDFPAHHDVEPTPDGNLLTMTFVDREVTHPRGGNKWIIDDTGVIANPQGKVIEEYSLWDLFTASPKIVDVKQIPSRGKRGGHQVFDIFHMNSAQWIVAGGKAGTHPIYADGNILVTIRHQNIIAVFDPRLRQFIWSWGRGELQGPHHARMLPNGNIVVFDNGLRRRTSRVLQMDPRTGTIVWKYNGDKDNPFFSMGGSSAEPLPNGNTLVAVNAEGRLFEVTPQGEVVWHYINPIDSNDERRGAIHAASRHPLAVVAPILARHQDSASGG
jgi:outer membrane protein assembly factor BamB